MKYGLFFIFLDVLCAIGALLNIYMGEASIDDYIVLFFSIDILLICIVRWALKEIEIRKKMKEIRKEREERERTE